VTTLPDQVHNGPVIFASLEEVKRQFGELPTTQSAAQQNGEERSVALAFEGLDPGRLPKTTSLLCRQPIPKSDTEFFRSLDATYACGEFGLSSPASAAS
jgi:hypothetical protein